MSIETITYGDREAWLRIRNRDVTASAVAALFDAHPWVSLFDLWAQKTGRKPRAESDDANGAIMRGILLEEPAVKALRYKFPKWNITHNTGPKSLYFRDADKRLGATPDVIVGPTEKGRKGIIQIKSVEPSIFRKKWFEDGELEAPLWIALQATLEAYLTGADWAAVGAFVVGHTAEINLVEIPLVDGVIDVMAAKTAEFFRMVADGREPPPDFNRDGPVIEAMYGDGDPEVEVDLTADNRVPELIALRRRLMAERRGTEAAIEALDAEIKFKIGAATVAHIADGQKITWKLQRRAGGFQPESTSRALRYPTERN